MFTVQGKSKQKGIAIATAVVINTQTGINGVSPALLREGISALSKGCNPDDYAEIVVVCDTLLIGSSIKIPGVRTIGIAAEQDSDIPGLDLEVPCVTGLSGIIKDITDDTIVIVDGDKGLVHADPDPNTLMIYQQKEERYSAKPALFIESEHIPAKTQSGETITAYAYVSNELELIKAINNGADGIVVAPWGCDKTDCYNAALHLAAGKPVVFKEQYLDMSLIRAVMRMAVPYQVTVLFPAQEYNKMSADAEAVLKNAVAEAFLNDLEPARINTGAFSRDNELAQAEAAEETSCMLIDIRKSAYLGTLKDRLEKQVPLWISGLPVEDVIFLIGDNITIIGNLVKGGARSIAVNPDSIDGAKFLIRSITTEDME